MIDNYLTFNPPKASESTIDLNFDDVARPLIDIHATALNREQVEEVIATLQLYLETGSIIDW